MTNLPIGLSTGCFYQRNILDCLESIRASGFSQIEVCSSPLHLDFHDLPKVRALAARLEDLGMEAYSFHAPFADRIDLSSLSAARRDASVEEILRAVEAAAALQVHYFVIHPGPEHAHIPPDTERLQRIENLVESLNRVVRRCAEVGICCLLENKLPHLLFGNLHDILWILAAIEGAEVGACLDTGHAFLSGDLPNLLRKLAGPLRMIHAHDNRRKYDDHLPPGDGQIDWTWFLGELVQANFRGALILELAGQPDVEATLSGARRGRAYLRKVARTLEARRWSASVEAGRTA
jgi:sugar phosphate isomerase/epimerase